MYQSVSFSQLLNPTFRFLISYFNLNICSLNFKIPTHANTYAIKSAQDYKDPVRVHKMLIDERMEKIRNQSEFANLEEELHRLKGELDDQKRKKESQKIISTFFQYLWLL